MAEVVSYKRAFKLLKELGYERVSCSLEEKKTAEALLNEVTALGVDAHIEEFDVECGRVLNAKLVVTEPYVKEYPVTGYERSLSTPEGGIDAEFVYAEDGLEVNLENVKGKIIMLNGRVSYKLYKQLKKAAPAAVITFSGTTIDRESETDILIRKFRTIMTDEFGVMTGLNMRAKDAAEIVRRGATKMHIELKAENYVGISQNVCAVIKGTEKPDEIVSFGAHYDSVYFSTGVYDNMAGSVIIMELLRYFKQNPPKRTVKFNWYGSEEQGLLGSKAWVKAHTDELSSHVCMINVDVAAATLGTNKLPIIANDAGVGYIESMMKELGFPCVVKSDIYSSDCIPFSDNGVPAINICRFGAHGADYIHDRRDNLKSNYIDEKALGKTLDIALEISKRLVNAKTFPIKKEIPAPLKEKVDEYLMKKPNDKK